MRAAAVGAVDAAVDTVVLILFFGFPRRFEVPRQRFGCQGGTGLQASVSLGDVFLFVQNTFRYKGLLNCAGEHRGELCWESAGFRADPPRPLLLL